MPHAASSGGPSPERGTDDAGHPDIDELTDAVLTASRLLVAISASSIASLNEPITLPQFRLLVVLHTRGGLKLAALAEELGVTPSTATRTVDRLVSSGLVHRQASPSSRREVALSLTEGGRNVVTAVTDRRREKIADIVTRMPAESRQGLVQVLWEFTKAGGEPPARGGGYPVPPSPSSPAAGSPAAGSPAAGNEAEEG